MWLSEIGGRGDGRHRGAPSMQGLAAKRAAESHPDPDWYSEEWVPLAKYNGTLVYPTVLVVVTDSG